MEALRPMARQLSLHDAIRSLPPRVARQYRVVPLSRDAQGAVFGAVDPHDWRLESVLSRHADGPFRVVGIAQGALEQALQSWYGPTGDLHDFIQSQPSQRGASLRLGDALNSAGAVRFVELMIRAALSERASDIHLDPGRGKPRLRFRLDGILVERPAPTAELAQRATSHIKALCSMDLGSCTYAQDGQFSFSGADGAVDVRVSVLPTDQREVTVLRLLTDEIGRRTLAGLGMPPRVQQLMEMIAGSPHGLVIIAGPTGAGKTTTLHAVLRLVDASTRNVVSIEDPIEIRSPDIRQVPVRRNAGLDFANALRAVVRQDPDVILVGETRDAETAGLVVQSSLAGHLVFTTVHANDCPAIFQRFSELGASRTILAETTRAVLSQRLLRLCCPLCAGNGCFPCEGSGLRGRQAVYECMPIEGRVESLVAHSKRPAEILAAARDAGFRTMEEHAAELVAERRTTAAEVRRVLGRSGP